MVDRVAIAQREHVKRIIQGTSGRFASVEFTKADGSLRRMQVHPAAGKAKIKGTKRTPSAPNIYNVWDVGKKGFRSINLDTVSAVTADGIRFEIRKAK